MTQPAKNAWTAPEVHLLRSARSAEIGTAQESGETVEKTQLSTLPSGNV